MKTVLKRVAGEWGALCAALVLTACGGGGSGSGGDDGSGGVAAVAPVVAPADAPPTAVSTTSSTPPAVVATVLATPDIEVVALADATNIASSGFPWNGRFAGVIKRWTLPIPVKTNGEPRAVSAMDAIEKKLGLVLFDRTSIANVDEAAITRGIVFRQGTSYLPAGANPQAYCANVARAPFDGGYPSTFMFVPGEISARLYVNLDNPQCTASADIVIHEFGHALGMGAHFAGFGDDDAIGPAFWPVLATLYANPIGTPKAAVVIRQVKN